MTIADTEHRRQTILVVDDMPANILRDDYQVKVVTGGVDRERARRGTPCGGGGERGQVQLPRQHEPRDTHADERHHRPVLPVPAERPRQQAAKRRREGAPLGRITARRHQRHPRRLRDRGRQAGHGITAVPARAGADDRHGPRAAQVRKLRRLVDGFEFDQALEVVATLHGEAYNA